MDQETNPKTGCSILVKLLFFLSVLLNIILLLAAVYIYGLVKSFSTGDTMTLPGINSEENGPAPADHPLLNDEQEKTLQGLGIDVGKLPAEITPEMENCFEQAVGVDRAEEIKGGATLSPADILKAKACL